MTEDTATDMTPGVDEMKFGSVAVDNLTTMNFDEKPHVSM
jgi:hypothetical protein